MQHHFIIPCKVDLAEIFSEASAFFCWNQRKTIHPFTQLEYRYKYTFLRIELEIHWFCLILHFLHMITSTAWYVVSWFNLSKCLTFWLCFSFKVGEITTDLGKHQHMHDRDDLAAEQVCTASLFLVRSSPLYLLSCSLFKWFLCTRDSFRWLDIAPLS